MGDAANPFEAVRAMMLENLEKVQSATQSYMDTVEKAMRGFPGANEEQITTFKAYLERKVAANRPHRLGYEIIVLRLLARRPDGISIAPKEQGEIGPDPGDPRIDRAADRFDGRSLHGRASIVDRSSLSRRPKKRGPFHLVPVMAKATLERLS